MIWITENWIDSSDQIYTQLFWDILNRPANQLPGPETAKKVDFTSIFTIEP